MTQSNDSSTVVVTREPPHRYTVICWNDDCNEPLDTYGRTEDVVRMARQHVERNGCTLRIEVQSIIEVAPAAALPGEQS